MTKRELRELRPWVEAGIGVVIDDYAEPLFVRKGYLATVADGYVLTERGAEQADQLLWAKSTLAEDSVDEQH